MAYYPPQTNRIPSTYMNQPFNPNPMGTTGQVQMAGMGLKGHPVASFDEVRATGIDFDGSVFFFPDLSNKRIYTKQIGMDGSPVYNFYELNETPIQSTNVNTGDFVTRDEFEKTMAQLRDMFAQIQTAQVQQQQPKQPEQFNF